MIDAERLENAGRGGLYGLARTVYADPKPAMRAAAELRDRHFADEKTPEFYKKYGFRVRTSDQSL